MTDIPKDPNQDQTADDGADDPKTRVPSDPFEAWFLNHIAKREISGVPKDFDSRIAIDPSGRAVHVKGSSEVCKTCCNLEVEHVSSGQRAPVWPEEISHSTRFVQLQVPECMNFWTTLGALKESAEQTGCQICRTLASGVCDFEDQREWTSRIIWGYEGINCWVVLLPMSVKVYVWWSGYSVPDQIEFYHLDKTLLEVQLGVRPPFGFGLPLRSPAEISSPEFAQEILNKCKQCEDPGGSHFLCHNRPSQKFTPTRLLDIGDGQIEKPTIKVCHPDPGVKYVALSHRWPSKTPVLRLLKHMFLNPSGSVEFAWGDQTKMYQDVISFTKGLGIRYLWIDSLCIIQDDDDDWEREAALMSVIYDNAYLTLAVNSRTFSRTGSLMPKHKGRPPAGFLERELCFPGLVVQLTREAWIIDQVCVRRVHGSPPNKASNLQIHVWMGDRFGNAPELLHRGWCFQERLAARRILHFAPDEFFFECDFGYSCECTGNKTILSSLKTTIARNFQMLDYFGSDVGFSWPIWESLVQQYTMTRFTHDEDVLPALIYLAQKFQDSTGMTYVAGLWKEAMPQCLLWHPTSRDGATPALRKSSKKGNVNYVAPSFSWASSAELCTWFNLPENAAQEATVVGCGTTPRGSHLLGAITSGFIQMSGRLATMQQSDLDWLKKHTQWCGRFLNALKFDAGCAEDDPRKVYLDSSDHIKGASILYLFQIYRYQNIPMGYFGSTPSEARECAVALILCPEVPGSTTRFRRIGIAMEALPSIFHESSTVEITIV